MIKKLFFLFLFINVCDSLNSTSEACSLKSFAKINETEEYEHCNVLTEPGEIYNGKNCSNLWYLGTSKQEKYHLYDLLMFEIYLERMDNYIMKQWYIYNSWPQYSVNFTFENKPICDMLSPRVYDSKVDVIFLSGLKYYYATWDLYDSKPEPTVTFLSDDFHSYFISLQNHILILNYSNKTLMKTIFSKNNSEIQENYELEKFTKEITKVDLHPVKDDYLIVTLESLGLQEVELKNQLHGYQRYSNTSSYDSSFGRYKIKILPNDTKYSLKTDLIIISIIFLIFLLAAYFIIRNLPEDKNPRRRTTHDKNRESDNNTKSLLEKSSNIEVV